MIECEHIRKGGVIRKAVNGDVVFEGSINGAKRKSRELQTKGLGLGQVRIEPHKQTSPARSGRNRKKKKRTKYGRPLELKSRGKNSY